jgi:hypothetical protein
VLHVVRDDGGYRARRRVAQVRGELLGDGPAEQAKQGDQDEQAREDGLDAEVCQRRRAVLQVIIFVFLQGPLDSLAP